MNVDGPLGNSIHKTKMVPNAKTLRRKNTKTLEFSTERAQKLIFLDLSFNFLYRTIKFSNRNYMKLGLYGDI